MNSMLFPCSAMRATASDADEKIWESLRDDCTAASRKDGHFCDECNSDRAIQIKNEEIICTRCGSHIGYLIDTSAEYRWFGSDDHGPDPSRVGNPMNPLLPEFSLGTRILARPGESPAMRRIRQYHLWNIMPYRERTLWTVFEGLQVRAANAGISAAIVEETKQLYAQVSPHCICRGAQKDALLAACLFESLKRHDTPRRPAEIAEIFQIDVKLITRGVKQFSALLDTHNHVYVGAAPATSTKSTTASKPATASAAPERDITPSTSFKHYLDPAIYKLETPRYLHTQILAYSSAVGDMIDELGICPETTPSSLAASALMLAVDKFGLEKNPTDVAKVCGISVATLQKCLKRIEAWRAVIDGNASGK